MMSFVLLKVILGLWLRDEMHRPLFFMLVAVTTGMFLLYVLSGVFASFLASKLGVCAGKSLQGALYRKLLTLSNHHLVQ